MTLPKANRLTQPSAQGQTLIEALVTMVILGVGIAGVTQLTTFIADRLAYNRNYANASALAEQVMEEVRTYGCAPNAEIGACERLYEHYMIDNDDNNPKLYCWPSKGTPTEQAEDDDCEGTLFRAEIRVSTPLGAHHDANEAPFQRTYMLNGNSAGTTATLDNIANVRVTVRWNDVNPDKTTNSSKRPMFVVYQTRVTQ